MIDRLAQPKVDYKESGDPACPSLSWPVSDFQGSNDRLADLAAHPHTLMHCDKVGAAWPGNSKYLPTQFE